MIDWGKYTWEHYLARPFNLLETSLWHEWYASPQTAEVFGIILANGLYIEHPRGTTRHYREAEQLKQFFQAIENIVIYQPEVAGRLLERAEQLNQQAEIALRNQDFKNLDEAITFLIRLALVATIFPYFGGEFLAKHGRQQGNLFAATEKLRAISYYPKFIQQVLNPLVQQELRERGVNHPLALQSMTLAELKRGDFSKLEERAKHIGNNKFFVYQNLNGQELVDWVEDPTSIINQIEGLKEGDAVLRGRSAYPGVVQGRARLVFGNNPTGVIFNDGEILVAVSTSPELVPLMKKAAAIITDEGGVTSHAAIVSRELKKPCIVGTQTATRVLKDGDLVEVDAERGIVRIIQ